MGKGKGRLSKGRPYKKRPRAKRYLVMCNGKVTEQQYFAWLVESEGLAGSVRVDNSLAGKDPYTMVKRAKKAKEEEDRRAKKEGFDSWERVWAVSDTDEFALGDAQRLAAGAGVELVLSNPCFEVWLIDHVTVCSESCAVTSACEAHARKVGVLQSTSAERAEKRRFKSVNCSALEGRVDDAMRNAARHNTAEKRMARQSTPDRTERYAVWTDVPAVIQAFREAAGGMSMNRGVFRMRLGG